MKLQSLSIILSILFLFGCSKEELTPNKQTEKNLSEEIWELSETKIDGKISNKYDGLALQFGSNVYTSTKGGSLWPASGTWEFVGEKGDKVLRDDGLAITIVSASAAQLTMSFFWATTIYENGRANAIKGQHEMIFIGKPK